MTCARRCRRSTPPSSSARPTRRRCRSCSSSCANSKTTRFRASCSSTRSTRRTACPRCAQAAAAGLARAAAAAPDSDLERRHHHRLRRSRARARVCLQGARAVRGRSTSRATTLDREKEARFTMLETLADHDDELMEQLLEDIQPPRDKVFDDLAKELRDRSGRPGAARAPPPAANGVLRLLKALRHEAPGIAETVARLGVKAGNDAVALVLKTFHTTHGGKMSVGASARGPAGDGTTFNTPTARGRPRVRRVQAHGPALREARPGARRRDRRLRQARSCQDRRHVVGRQAGARRRSPR